MWEVIRELVREGSTLLLTTQYLDEADTLADRIAVIDSGTIIAEGTGDELKDQVGGQVVTVTLRDAGDRQRAIDALAPVGCEQPHDDPEPNRLSLPVHRDGVGLVADAARALGDADIEVLDLALRRPTLDDVFLELTGHHATDATDTATGDRHPTDATAGASP